MCADIVIVGGGPVGCWTAIQAKKRNPALDIHIYERYPEYQRDHMMSIKRKSLTCHSKLTGDALEKDLYRKIGDANSDAYNLSPHSGLKKVTHIRTLTLEAILKEQCEKLGIGFTYEEVGSPEDIMARHPECNRFVAADGAHSKMRTALLGEDSVISRNLLHSVDVKYKAQGQPEYLMEPTYDKLDMIVVETVGKEKDGYADVGLRFLVNEETYDHFPDATFKKPLSLTDIQRNPNLENFRDQLETMWQLRSQYAGESRAWNSERITKIKLSQYASKKFAVTSTHKNRRAGWFLVGDAAMGMPFYRSINSGLMQGSQLGHILANPQFSAYLQTAAYNTLRPFKLAREFGAVSAKLSGIRAYKNVVRPCLQGVAMVGIGVVAVPLIIPAAATIWALNRMGCNIRLM